VADNNQVLQLTIHRTDKLKSNLYIAHPVVRVHIINLETGNCVKKQKKCVAVVLLFVVCQVSFLPKWHTVFSNLNEDYYFCKYLF